MLVLPSAWPCRRVYDGAGALALCGQGQGCCIFDTVLVLLGACFGHGFDRSGTLRAARGFTKRGSFGGRVAEVLVPEEFRTGLRPRTAGVGFPLGQAGLRAEGWVRHVCRLQAFLCSTKSVHPLSA